MNFSEVSDDEQRRRLNDLMKDTADWMVLMVMSRPGDVAVAVSPAPNLRGYEIVSASPNPNLYDIWRRRKRGVPRPVKMNLNKREVGEWVAQRTPPEADFMTQGRQWVEDMMAFYDIKPRDE